MACAGSTPTITGYFSVVDGVACNAKVSATFDIPCGSSGYTASLYIKKGVAPTTADTPVEVHTLPYGPASDAYTYNAYDLNCHDPGLYYYMVSIQCGGDGTDLAHVSDAFTLVEQDPDITGHAAVIDSDACTYQAQASYASPCGVKDATWTCKIFKRKGAPSALIDGDLIAGPIAIPCGVGNQQITGNGSISGKGQHYFTYALYKNGAIFSTVVETQDCLGCEDDQLTLYGPNSVPYDGVEEVIWLVKPVKSASGFAYNDQRVLSTTYRMIDWFYYRNGGCGPFDIVLGEYFPELEIALQEGWEIHVRIQFVGETSFTTWYRGVIRSGERRQEGTDLIAEIRGQGYCAQLADVYVAKRYAKGTYVRNIVKDLVDNYIRPNTRIVRPVDLDNTKDDGIDTTIYVTKGPLHFECSVLKALKFLSELEGNMEFGVSADRCFYFRAKQTVMRDALFTDNDLTHVVDAGKEVQKVNQIRVDGKQFGNREFLAVVGDKTDITKYGLYERPIEVPWIEQQDDAVQWANNIIARKKNMSSWKTVTWPAVGLRLERDHPTTGLHMLRMYGANTATDYSDNDITKLHYVKGGIVGKGSIAEMRRPKDQPQDKTPQLQVTITTGYHHHDLVEELEEKIFDQVAAIKGKLQQFRNLLTDVTLPMPLDVSLYSGQMQALTSDANDITNGPIAVKYWDGSAWREVVGLRTAEQLPVSGAFPGEEFIKWSGSSHTTGVKYYWDGLNWQAWGTGGGGSAVAEGARVIRTTDQVISTGGTDVQYTTTQSNDNGVANLAGNNKILTCQTSGVFVISGRVKWKAGSDGTYHTLKLINITTGETLDLDKRTDFIVNNQDKGSVVSWNGRILAGDQIKMVADSDAADDGITITYASLEMYSLGGGTPTSAVGSPTGPAGGDLSGTYPSPSIALLAVTDAKVATANKDGARTTPSMRTLGYGVNQAAPPDDVTNSTSGLVPHLPPDHDMEFTGDATWQRRYVQTKSYYQFDVNASDYTPARAGTGFSTLGTFTRVFLSDNSCWKQLHTGASNGNKGGIHAVGSADFSRLGQNPGFWAKVRTDSNIAAIHIFIGFSSSGDQIENPDSADAAVGFFYGSDTPSGAGFWQIRVGKDTVNRTTIVTAYPIITNTEYKLHWDATKFQTDGTIRFYINDTLVYTFNDASKLDISKGMDPQFLIMTMENVSKNFYLSHALTEQD